MSASAIRAGAAYIELTLRDRVSRPLQSASMAVRDFGNSVAWQGTQIAAMGAAITAPLAAIAHSFASAALEGQQLVGRRDAANVMGYVGALLRLQSAFGDLRNALGAAVLPLMQRWPNALARILTQSAAWVRANRGLVQTIARTAAAVATAGTAIAFAGKIMAAVGTVLGVLSTAATAAATAMGLVTTVLGAALSPIGLLIVAATAFGAVMLHATGLAGEAVGWLQGKFAELKDDAIKTFDGIADALATGNIKLAAEILWLAIKMEWQKGVNWINQQWINAKELFTKVWTDAAFALEMLMTDPWYAIETAYNETLSTMQKGWITFTGFLSTKLNWAVGEMEKLWVRFRKWIGEDIDVEARVKEIDATTKEAETQLDADTAARKNATETRRQARKAEIDSRRTPAADAVADRWNEAQAANVAEFERQRKDSEKAVADAKNAWTNARTKAKDERVQFDRRNLGGDEIRMALGEQKGQMESKGTFNAAAARGLGSDSLAERTARATERGADLLRQIENRVRNAGAVFA